MRFFRWRADFIEEKPQAAQLLSKVTAARHRFRRASISGGGILRREVGRAKYDVPDRENGAVVAGVTASRTQSMMQTVKARRDKQPVAEPAKGHADIGVAQAFDETHEQEEQRKLQRRNTDRQTDHAKPECRDQIV